MAETRTFHKGDRVVVLFSWQRGTVEGRAGDWSGEDVRDWYSIRIGDRHYILHADQMRLESEYDDLSAWFDHLLEHGCQSGMISRLCYYRDTHAFYDRYYSEIEDLRQRFEGDLGEPLKVGDDLKNWFAWFAFEQTASDIYNELY